MDVKFSIIICTYNRSKYLLPLLESIKQQSINKNLFEVVFINNNSPDNTEWIVNQFISDNRGIKINYFIEERQGLSYARNRGIKEAKGEFLIFIDDDAIMTEDYLKSLNTYLANDDDIKVYGGKILPLYETEKPEWVSPFLLSLFSVIDLGNEKALFPKSKYPIGANMGFNKNIFVKYGNFKTDLGRKGKLLLGGEEKDLFNRVKENVYYLPDTYVYHNVPNSRTQKQFIKKQGFGIGMSERLRLKERKPAYLKRIVKELYLWGGTLTLATYYLLFLKYMKSEMLIVFRWNVTKGLIKNEPIG